jgi:hypothetical protein
MADAQSQTPPRVGATLWSLLMIVCLLLAVGHLVDAVRHDTVSPADLIEDTFATVRPESGS